MTIKSIRKYDRELVDLPCSGRPSDASNDGVDTVAGILTLLEEDRRLTIREMVLLLQERFLIIELDTGKYEFE